MGDLRRKFPPRGAGGGKPKSPRAPVEAEDSLRSKQYARVLDLVSEGQIRGLVNGMKSVFVDDTPIENADGSRNFPDFSVTMRTGTPDQEPIPGFDSVESEVVVDSEMKHGAAVTRQIVNSEMDFVRVTIGIPALMSTNVENGDVNGTSVSYKIERQSNGAGFQEILTDTVSGKTSTLYQRSYIVPLTGPAPWDIRVTRLTSDSNTGRLQNKTIWRSYTGIVSAKMRYPNSAIVGVQFDASVFNNVPNRAYEIYGLIVKVPSNYDPITRTYTGIWDGTFKPSWTDNPVWVFYDLITMDRYGLGGHIDPNQIDKWELYTAAQYCDELVSDGKGGQEPRFTCNVYLQTREDALKVISNVASIFRAMVFWSAGALSASIDMPQDVFKIYTNANVLNGKFSYNASDGDVRHTVAYVTWSNPDLGYKQDIEVVDTTQELIDRYGYNELETLAFGCTSKGQAHRWGRWALYSETSETEIVSFRTGLDGQTAYPGAVIQIADKNRAGKRMGGRVRAATANTVTIDAPITIEAGVGYSLMVINPNGAIESREIIATPGQQTVLTAVSDFTVQPQPDAVWVVSASNLIPTTWRVVSVAESEKHQAEIIAVAHNPSKFGAIEDNLTLEERPTSVITANPPTPSDLNVVEHQVEIGPGVVERHAIFSWHGTTGRYDVTFRRASDNWTELNDVVVPSVDLGMLPAGEYTFNVRQVSSLGKPSQVATITKTLRGADIEPVEVPNVSGLEIKGQGLDRIFTTRDCAFTWRRTRRNAVELGSESLGAGTGNLDPDFKDFEVRIYDPDGTERHVTWVTQPQFTYLYTQNLADRGGSPARAFTIKVWQRGRYNQKSPVAAVLDVSNPQLELPVISPLRALFRGFVFEQERPSAEDYDYTLVWVGSTADFTPTGFEPGVGNCKFKGRDTPTIIDCEPGTTYYVKYAAVDKFGPSGLTISSSLTVTTLHINAVDIAAGIINESHLWASLNQRINLIDGSSSTPGTIPYQINQEALTRAAAVTAEASARSTAILNEASTRANADSGLQTQINTLVAGTSGDLSEVLAAIEDEQVARTNADTAEATARETLATQIRGAYTGTDINALSTGLIYSERTARITQDNALASSISALTVTVNNNTAAITSEATTRASADTALSNTLNTLSSTVTNNYNSLNSSITAEANTRAGSDTALSNSINAEATTRETLAAQLRGTYTGTDVNLLTTGLIYSERVARVTQDNALSSTISSLTATVNSNTAAINAEATTRANADSSLSTMITNVATNVTNNYNTLNAAISSETTARTNADSALTVTINNLTTTVNGNTSTLSIQGSSINGLQAQYTVKIDNNGYVSGYGLASTVVNDTPLSEFYVRADRFAIGYPGASRVVPFSVIGGVTYIDSAMIRAASIVSAQIYDLAADKITGGTITASVSMTAAHIIGGDLTLSSTGFIKIGSLEYSTGLGSGLWTGMYGGTGVLMVGSPTNNMKWTGTELIVRGNVKDVREYTPGEIPLEIALGSSVADGSYGGSAGGIAFQIRVNRNGVLRIKWDTIAISGAMYARVYINGSVAGPENAVTSTSWVTISNDITVAAGDNVQLMTGVGAGSSGQVRNFGVYCSFSEGVVTTLVNPHFGAGAPAPVPAEDDGGGSNDSLHPDSQILMQDRTELWLKDCRVGMKVISRDPDTGDELIDEIVGFKYGRLGDTKYFAQIETESGGVCFHTPGHLLPKKGGGWQVVDPDCYITCSWNKMKSVKTRQGATTVHSVLCPPNELHKLQVGDEILRDDGVWERVEKIDLVDHFSPTQETIAVLLKRGKVVFSDGYAVGTLA